ncbi:hypothetical protein OE88DRAFT_1733130 [Heliocybe sulcata]|uniref:AB hydrolase-1 domain-containing protein n=1 Tax=Heliocybe sulcata TaxID=5364 RepID=A0A5C3NDE3_9AGAM|nr:hypothetical protein OE88DRAFT_1733130 [Heliocybe sulcata]
MFTLLVPGDCITAKPFPYNGPYFPAVSHEDNVRAQYTVLTKKLGLEHIYCVFGFSMGGQLSYHWPVMYPDYLDKYVVVCGSARTSPHNIAYETSKSKLTFVMRLAEHGVDSFLEGPKAAMKASKDFEDGHYKSIPQHGIRAFGRVYCPWAYGQTWFRNHGYLLDGLYSSLEDFLRERWEGNYLNFWDANDMLALVNTWQTADVSKVKDGGDLEKCLGAIKVKGLIMPCKTDLYFTPEDSQIEVSYMKDTAKLVIIDSVWGHVAGGSSSPRDLEFVQAQVKAFLESE